MAERPCLLREPSGQSAAGVPPSIVASAVRPSRTICPRLLHYAAQIGLARAHGSVVATAGEGYSTQDQQGQSEQNRPYAASHDGPPPSLRRKVGRKLPYPPNDLPPGPSPRYVLATYSFLADAGIDVNVNSDSAACLHLDGDRQNPVGSAVVSRVLHTAGAAVTR